MILLILQREMLQTVAQRAPQSIQSLTKPQSASWNPKSSVLLMGAIVISTQTYWACVKGATCKRARPPLQPQRAPCLLER